jgi:hypothetical protein
VHVVDNNVQEREAELEQERLRGGSYGKLKGA